MTRMSFQDAAEAVKRHLDIVDVIQRFVMLKKSGRNYLGKCPFHNDKSPSMNVSREKGIFKCFACGAGGDTLAFLMKIENKTYGELIRDLAEDQGIDIQYEGRDPEVAATQRDAKTKILDLNSTSNAWFQARLQEPTAEPVVEYLAGRYTDALMLNEAIERFQIGYAPPGWENLTPYLKQQFDFVQASPDLLVTAGLANSREHGQGHYDRFRHRLMIPIHDEKGQVVAFGGRALKGENGEEDKPKYMNSPETIVYHKSNVLYGFFQAKDSIRQLKRAVIMEGYFDVISAHLGGITEAVGSCGTAMTENHLKLLARFGAETVYLAFDSDEAGLKAALSAISLMEGFMDGNNLQVKVLVVPNGKDPDDFIRSQGGDAFQALLTEAKHYLDFKLEMAIKGLEVSSPEGRIQAANRLTPVLAAIARPTVRMEYMRLYAERIGISEEALLLEVKRYEQAHNPVPGPPFGNFQNSAKKKAISKYAGTYSRSNKPLLTDNLSELRSTLGSRVDVAEKNLLRLALANPESYSAMMSFVESRDEIRMCDPVRQTILDGLKSLAAGFVSKTDPLDDGSFGTLLDKMNHLYFNEPDVLGTFAELVLTAESFCDSLGLGELKGSQLREKVTILAEQQVQQLARCHQQQQLATIKNSLIHKEGEPIELTYQFQDQLEAARHTEPESRRASEG